MANLELTNVCKHYGNVPAVREVNLTCADGEFTVLVGPSGCGKTTTLRMIAGLEQADAGELLLDGQRINDWPPRARDMAMVFQRYSLYPHLSVRENIAFGLKARHIPDAETKEQVNRFARLLHIEHLLDRRPGQLSGGEQQRVAIGRALVRNPRVYLLDEPLSNLDAKLRIEMRGELKRLHQEFPTTTVYVTHDQSEAMSLGDRLVVMDGGRVVQEGRPLDVYRHPRHVFVAGFIGNPAMNLVKGRVERDQGGLYFRSDGLDITLPANLTRPLEQGAFDTGDSFVLGIRPEHLAIGEGPRSEVLVVEPLGAETLVLVRIGSDEVRLRLDDGVLPVVGERLSCRFPPEHLHLFHGDNGVSVTAGNGVPAETTNSQVTETLP